MIFCVAPQSSIHMPLSLDERELVRTSGIVACKRCCFISVSNVKLGQRHQTQPKKKTVLSKNRTLLFAEALF